MYHPGAYNKGDCDQQEAAKVEDQDLGTSDLVEVEASHQLAFASSLYFPSFATGLMTHVDSPIMNNSIE
jgi:hypothetical protein